MKKFGLGMRLVVGEREKSRQRVWYKQHLCALCPSCRMQGVKTLGTRLLASSNAGNYCCSYKKFTLSGGSLLCVPVAVFATRIKIESSNQHLFYSPVNESR